MAQILLHGNLHVTIFDAQELSTAVPAPAPQSSSASLRHFVEGIEDTVGVGKGSSKLYATIDLEKARVGRTRMLSNETVNPRWFESFHIYCAHLAADVIFTVKADNAIGAALIGEGVPTCPRASGW
ncbi:hypothetical protein ACQ4PT_052093 [Festuca glaucescens]